VRRKKPLSGPSGNRKKLEGLQLYELMWGGNARKAGGKKGGKPLGSHQGQPEVTRQGPLRGAVWEYTAGLGIGTYPSKGAREGSGNRNSGQEVPEGV